MTWKDKHEKILRDKNIIIETYNKYCSGYGDSVKVCKKIASVYGVSVSCIHNHLHLWGIKKDHGIKYQLRRLLLEND